MNQPTDQAAYARAVARAAALEYIATKARAEAREATEAADEAFSELEAGIVWATVHHEDGTHERLLAVINQDAPGKVTSPTGAWPGALTIVALTDIKPVTEATP